MCLMSYGNNKGADQPAHSRSLISAFVVRCLNSIISLDSIAEISRLASFCGCAGRFVSGLVGNSRRHIFSCRGSSVLDIFLGMLDVAYFCGCIFLQDWCYCPISMSRSVWSRNYRMITAMFPRFWTDKLGKQCRPTGHLKCSCMSCLCFFPKTRSPSHNFYVVINFQKF